MFGLWSVRATNGLSGRWRRQWAVASTGACISFFVMHQLTRAPLMITLRKAMGKSFLQRTRANGTLACVCFKVKRFAEVRQLQNWSCCNCSPQLVERFRLFLGQRDLVFFGLPLCSENTADVRAQSLM